MNGVEASGMRFEIGNHCTIIIQPRNTILNSKKIIYTAGKPYTILLHYSDSIWVSYVDMSNDFVT